MAGRHAKRTTIRRYGRYGSRFNWVVHLATFDAPARTYAPTFEEAIESACRFEFLKTPARHAWASAGDGLELDPVIVKPQRIGYSIALSGSITEPYDPTFIDRVVAKAREINETNRREWSANGKVGS